MKKVHLLCSSNWNPKTAKSNLAPLQTMLGHLASEQIKLTKLILIQGTLAGDFQYCRLAMEELERRNLSPAICTSQDDGRPEKIANEVSKAAEQAADDQAELWVDLTPGPKQRAAVFFAASSAIAGVKIVYSEAKDDGKYVVDSIPRLESYNEWMGRHGLRIRNYVEELKPLALRRSAAEATAIQAAVPDLLSSKAAFGPLVLSVASALFPLAEDVAKRIIPQELFNLSSLSNWDAIIMGAKEEWRATAARAGQTAYLLRNLFVHGDKSKDAAGNLVPRLLDIHDALALLDCLAYLSARLHPTSAAIQPSNEQMVYVAVDGDDVGRRFEEQLAACVTEADAEQLYIWSWKIQESLAEQLAELMGDDKYEGHFIARTGDGFLAAVPQRHYAALKANFKPRLAKETATTGIGPTIKEAYLALKLGKARNRGGGWFFSFQPLTEEMLWQAES